MRLLIRLAIVWLVLMPIGLYFGYPYLIAEVTTRLQGQTYDQCIKQTAVAPVQFPPDAPAIADHYCKCIADGVSIDKHDLITLVRHQPTTALNERVAIQVNSCSDRLQNPHPTDPQILRF